MGFLFIHLRFGELLFRKQGFILIIQHKNYPLAPQKFYEIGLSVRKSFRRLNPAAQVFLVAVTGFLPPDFAGGPYVFYASCI